MSALDGMDVVDVGELYLALRVVLTRSTIFEPTALEPVSVRVHLRARIMNQQSVLFVFFA